MEKVFGSNKSGKEEHWISISDLMSGLMIIFLFIAISYMKDIIIRKNRIEQIAVTWNITQESLYEDLYEEFKENLPKWQAILDRDTLSIRFQEPSVLFAQGKDEITPGFKKILDDFFPRYIEVLRSYRDEIEEIRIEGHTSSEWDSTTSPLNAYFKNMKLSQDRTRSVLEYCIGLIPSSQDVKWAIRTITANGLSSSRPILTNGVENPKLSRRVEFRVKTKAEQKIINILKLREGE